MRSSIFLAFPVVVAHVALAAMACSSSSSNNQSGGCQALLDCCAALPASTQPGCLANASAGDAVVCSTDLMAYQAGGLCGAAAGGSSSTVAASGCSMLASCCALMPGTSAVACNEVVNEGISTECSSELALDQAEGQCSSLGTHGSSGSVSSSTSACSALAECCAAMSGAAEVACDDVVSGGSSSTCASELSADQSAGLCSPSIGTGTGTGSFSVSTSSFQSSAATSATSSSVCETAPKLFPESAPGVYGPGVKTDAGTNATCAASDFCCEDPTVDGGTPSACSATACPAGAVSWQCLAPIDCPNAGTYCCGTGTLTNVPACGTQPTYERITGFAGTACTTSCPSWTVCEEASDCPSGQTCVPARALGSDFGVCTSG